MDKEIYEDKNKKRFVAVSYDLNNFKSFRTKEEMEEWATDYENLLGEVEFFDLESDEGLAYEKKVIFDVI